MTPIHRETINNKLFKLQESVKLLRHLKKESKNDFVKNKMIHSTAMFHLAIGIELIVDIGMHILLESFQEHAKNYADVIILLGDKRVIPTKFAKEQEEMPKFRNLLIHDYVKIKLAEVYEHTQEAPEIFSKFAGYYTKFIEKH